MQGIFGKGREGVRKPTNKGVSGLSEGKLIATGVSVHTPPITFNHGVEGSSPSALTTKPPTNKDLLNFPSHDPSRKFRVGRVWEGVGLSRCTLSPPFLTIDAGTNLRSL